MTMSKFEKYILNKITDNNDKSFAFRFLKEDCVIFCQELQLIYFAVKRLIDKDLPISVMTLTNEANLQKHNLDAIYDAPEIDIPCDKEERDDFEYCINRVKDDYRTFKIKQIAQEMLNKANKNNISEVIDKSMFEIGKVANQNTETEYAHPQDFMDRMRQWVRDIQDGKVIPTIKTDLLSFNEKVGGGFQYSDFIILKGYTGSGKTALGLHFAEEFGINQNIETAYFNMEMKETQLFGRIMASKTKNPKIKWENILKQESYQDPDFCKELFETMDFYAGKKLRFIHKNFPTIEEIDSNIREFNARYGTKIFFIDYIQRLQLPANDKREDRKKLIDVSKRLKTLAKSLDIIIIALVQSTEEGKTAEASYIDWEADLAFWVRLPEMEEMADYINNDYRSADITRVIEFTKNRMASSREVIPINYFGEKFQFSEPRKRPQ